MRPDHPRSNPALTILLLATTSFCWLADTAHGADVLVDSGEPMLTFDDTDDACCEWLVSAANGVVGVNLFELHDTVGGNKHTVLSIHGESGSTLNENTLVSDENGDLVIGNSLYLDRSEMGLHIGSLTSPARLLDVTGTSPDIGLVANGDGSQAEWNLFNGVVNFRGRPSAGVMKSFMSYNANTDQIAFASTLSQDLVIERGSPVLYLRDITSQEQMGLRFNPVVGMSIRTISDVSAMTVKPDAAGNSLVVSTNGRVGVNLSSPSQALHVGGMDAQVLVEEESAAVAPRTLFKLSNAGNTKFEIENWDAGNAWAFTNSGVDFRVSLQDSGVVEFRVDNNGDAFLDGVLTQNSDVHAKQAIRSVDVDDILARVAALPVSQWQYRDTPGVDHIGPMAQDFHAAFGLGSTDRGIATIDSAGVALAAIQALQRRNAELAERNEALENRLARIESALGLDRKTAAIAP